MKPYFKIVALTECDCCHNEVTEINPETGLCEPCHYEKELLKYSIVVTFDRPRSGYWDGGQKTGGTFEPELRNGFIEWGCWGLNYWFNGSTGRSPKHAVFIAKKRIERMLRIPATVEVVYKENKPELNP